MANVAKLGRPAYRRSVTNSNPKKTFITSERINLPLVSDGGAVDVLLNLTCYSSVISEAHVEITDVSPEGSVLLDGPPETTG
ncbi:MAG: hypothetical protein OSB46_13915 [Alphaproteobacteria bacterium]|nr:hypothetical protein [Alphaproteobacteria bacterium]